MTNSLESLDATLADLDRAEDRRRLDQWEMHRSGDVILTPELAAWAVKTERPIILTDPLGGSRVVSSPLVFDVTMCRLHIEAGDTFTKGEQEADR